MSLEKCIYGGGTSCEKQGGDGSLSHASEFVHPFPRLNEVGHPVGDFISKAIDEVSVVSIPAITVNFDENKSREILSLEINKSIDVVDLIKSLYDFELDTPEGISKLLQLLPVLDAEIVVDLVEKIWPGYAVENEDPALLRAEIKGYFLDARK